MREINPPRISGTAFFVCGVSSRKNKRPSNLTNSHRLVYINKLVIHFKGNHGDEDEKGRAGRTYGRSI